MSHTGLVFVPRFHQLKRRWEVYLVLNRAEELQLPDALVGSGNSEEEKKPTTIKAERWGMPGGNSEDNETPLKTAQREFEEETGFPGELVRDTLLRFERRTETHAVYVYAAFIPEGTQRLHPPGDEILDQRWFPLAELPKAHMYRSHTLRIDALLNHPFIKRIIETVNAKNGMPAEMPR